MNTSYVQTYPVEYGEFRTCCLTGSGPTSYSQTTADVIANPAANDYLAAVSACGTQSGTYFLVPVPTTAGVIRAGAPSASQSGWKFVWYTVSGMTQVSNGVNLSAEVVQFQALVTQL